MADYLERLQSNRESGVEYAASTHVKKRRKPKRLTKPARRGKLRLGVAASVKSLGKGKGRSTTKKKLEGSPMAKKKGKKGGKRKSGRLTKAEIKKAGGIPQAWRARKHGGGKKKKTKGKAKKSAPKRTAAKRSAPKHSAPKRSKSKGRKKSKSRSAPRRSSRTQTTRTVIQRLPGHTTRIAVVPVPAAARSSRKKSRKGKGRGKGRKGKKKGRKKGGQFKKGGGRRAKGAMENPMTGPELFIGMVTGLVGFLTADAVDRVLASHALTDKGTKDANGIELYADNPVTTGSYAGLFNATAICAPMDAKRWIVGLLVAGVPVTIAHFISAPTGRAALQFFGVAAGLRIVGKGLIDLVAMVTKANPVGQRLYDGEMRAAALKSGGASNPELASLPSAGLGRNPQVGAGCKPNCACAKCGAAKPATGAGYPSMPREVAPVGTTPTTQNLPPPVAQTPPPPPPGVVPPRPAASLTGTNGAPVKRFGQWGAPDNA